MTVTAPPEGVIWHDVECGGYDADLPVWERLAAEVSGPVLELGCGTGRVALHLARAGREVWGVDIDRFLLDTLDERAAARGLAVRTSLADVRELDLDQRFELALAPMQLLQVLPGPDARRDALRAIASHLAPEGRLAVAIVEGAPGAATAKSGSTAGVPDVRELGGSIYSSLPLGAAEVEGTLEVRRLRQVVSPEGRLRESTHTDRLAILEASTLEAEARSAGLRLTATYEIDATDAFVGSTVVLLEAP
jgi:SAM-dependent methyltransferase